MVEDSQGGPDSTLPAASYVLKSNSCEHCSVDSVVQGRTQLTAFAIHTSGVPAVLDRRGAFMAPSMHPPSLPPSCILTNCFFDLSSFSRLLDQMIAVLPVLGPLSFSTPRAVRFASVAPPRQCTCIPSLDLTIAASPVLGPCCLPLCRSPFPSLVPDRHAFMAPSMQCAFLSIPCTGQARPHGTFHSVCVLGSADRSVSGSWFLPPTPPSFSL
jgi:hypothetical protein